MKKRAQEKSVSMYPPGYLESVYDLLYTYGYSVEDVEYATGLEVGALNNFKSFADQVHLANDSTLTSSQICEEIEKRLLLVNIQSAIINNLLWVKKSEI